MSRSRGQSPCLPAAHCGNDAPYLSYLSRESHRGCLVRTRRAAEHSRMRGHAAHAGAQKGMQKTRVPVAGTHQRTIALARSATTLASDASSLASASVGSHGVWGQRNSPPSVFSRSCPSSRLHASCERKAIGQQRKRDLRQVHARVNVSAAHFEHLRGAREAP